MTQRVVALEQEVDRLSSDGDVESVSLLSVWSCSLWALQYNLHINLRNKIGLNWRICIWILLCYVHIVAKESQTAARGWSGESGVWERHLRVRGQRGKTKPKLYGCLYFCLSFFFCCSLLLVVVVFKCLTCWVLAA